MMVTLYHMDGHIFIPREDVPEAVRALRRWVRQSSSYAATEAQSAETLKGLLASEHITVIYDAEGNVTGIGNSWGNYHYHIRDVLGALAPHIRYGSSVTLETEHNIAETEGDRSRYRWTFDREGTHFEQSSFWSSTPHGPTKHDKKRPRRLQGKGQSR